ncbi:MarR family winged helix-turn-helix transcriptional regulator [Myceligenerans indicum]|uniref:Winged helix-turn-helix transcriptional regulator n=1 Tax=Myceligenerans indicum TaxID=2593663 RepID=A0ABS1LNJ8_9MICO|nr:MarR family winged helix-turn-helix transcriptional regulator [Myceligenerans indicum]MBL0887842.1 winged helix-turn-helix transcriptional regulator [Myceligenerans indicum]
MDAASEVGVDVRWSETLRTYHAVSNELEHELQAGHGLGLSDFELLKALCRCCAPDKGTVLMKDLEAEMYLSQSAFSRTVTRLEKAGFVERAACGFDRRSNFLAITDAGSERYLSAAETHRAVLDKHFG